MKKSLWDINIEEFPSLNHDCNCDICIVGGGLTGISLAYYLKDTPYKVILIEQNRLGHSTTVRSTAKLTYLQQDILSKIKRCSKEKTAFHYYNAQRDAIKEIVSIIKHENISCHLEKSPSYLFVQQEKNMPKLKQEFSLYKKFGANIKWTEKLPIDCGEKLCCFVEDTYVFHPLEYLKGLVSSIKKSKSIEIYEKSRMISYQKSDHSYIISLQNQHTIHTKKLVFAGHYPPFIFPYLFPVKVFLKKELVRVVKKKKNQFNAINLDQDIFSIRFYENYEVQVFHSKKLGNSQISKSPSKEDSMFYWSNYDIVTSNYLPIVGWIGNLKNGLYLGTGFNAWGMTNSNLAAQILSYALLEKKHPYAFLMRPYNYSFLSIAQKFINTFSNLYHFIASYFPVKSSARIVWENGHRVGIVTDSKKNQHKVLLTCPHMKCGIHYNAKEKTWDCPCHGSRFDLEGKLLRGPATDCIHIKESDD